MRLIELETTETHDECFEAMNAEERKYSAKVRKIKGEQLVRIKKYAFDSKIKKKRFTGSSFVTFVNIN